MLSRPVVGASVHSLCGKFRKEQQLEHERFLYLEICESDSHEFGASLAGALNKIREHAGTLVSISQSVVARTDAPGSYLRFAQVVFTVDKNQLGSTHGIHPDVGGFVDSFPVKE